MIHYISDGTWFDKDTEAKLIDDYRSDKLNSGLFSGVKNGKSDEEICSFSEFVVVED